MIELDRLCFVTREYWMMPAFLLARGRTMEFFDQKLRLIKNLGVIYKILPYYKL